MINLNQYTRKQLEALRDEIEGILAHTHMIIHQPWGSAKCKVCKHTYGWWCPDSPDSVCHYPEFEGVDVLDISRKPIALPESYEAKNAYNEEDCIFCGQPDERK